MNDEELAIGIDFGTAFSCAAVLWNGELEIFPNEIGESLTPSIVSFIDGEQTYNHLIKNPKKAIYSIKRLIGRDFKDEEVYQDIKSNFWAYDIVKKIIVQGLL